MIRQSFTAIDQPRAIDMQQYVKRKVPAYVFVEIDYCSKRGIWIHIADKKGGIKQKTFKSSRNFIDESVLNEMLELIHKEIESWHEAEEKPREYSMSTKLRKLESEFKAELVRELTKRLENSRKFIAIIDDEYLKGKTLEDVQRAAHEQMLAACKSEMEFVAYEFERQGDE